METKIQTEEMTERQLAIFASYAGVPIDREYGDDAIEAIADWTYDANIYPVEVEAHEGVVLVAADDGSVRLFDETGAYKGESGGRVNDALTSRLRMLNMDSGGDSECRFIRHDNGTPCLHVRSWSGSDEIGMVDEDVSDAVKAAEWLEIDDGGRTKWTWGTDEDGQATLVMTENTQQEDAK